MKYLIIGNKGQLGKRFEKIFKHSNCDYNGLDLPEVDITNQECLNNIFEDFKPEIVINCAAYNLVQNAEKDSETAFKINEKGVRNLAQECKKSNSFLVHYGTNYVFDGTKGSPYVETDPTNPINEYGRSKLAGEKAVQEELAKYLILRTSWLYGEGTQNFIYKFLQNMHKGKDIVVTTDDLATPTSTRILAEVTIKALENKLCGLYHVVNSGTASRFDWAKEILSILGIKKDIKKASVIDFNLPAKIPTDATLGNSKISKELGIKIPNWKDELKRFITEQNYFNFKL